MGRQVLVNSCLSAVSIGPPQRCQLINIDIVIYIMLDTTFIGRIQEHQGRHVVEWMSILCGQKATKPNHIHPVPIEGPLLTHNAAVILILLVIL